MKLYPLQAEEKKRYLNIVRSLDTVVIEDKWIYVQTYLWYEFLLFIS